MTIRKEPCHFECPHDLWIQRVFRNDDQQELRELTNRRGPCRVRRDRRDEPPEWQEFASELRPIEEQLLTALEADTVDDGRIHAGESLLAEAFEKHPTQVSLWARKVIEGTVAWPERAATLRLLARLTPMDAAWRAQIVSFGLRSRDVELRDAAVQAAESWADHEVIHALRTHQDPVPWLNEYASRVTKDLETSLAPARATSRARSSEAPIRRRKARRS